MAAVHRADTVLNMFMFWILDTPIVLYCCTELAVRNTLSEAVFRVGAAVEQQREGFNFP